MNIYEPEKYSQKPINDSQKSLIDTCPNCKKYKEKLKLQEKNVDTFCDLIDPTKKKSINQCIKDLEQIIKENKILSDYYKKTIKFINQQSKGREKIELDVDNIKYLRDIEKMTFEEIAKKFNVSRNTIRNRYYNN